MYPPFLPKRIVPFQIPLARPVSEVRASLAALERQSAGLLALHRPIRAQIADAGSVHGVRVSLRREARGHTLTMEGTLRADGLHQSMLEGVAAVDPLAWYLPLVVVAFGMISAITQPAASLATLPGLLVTAIPGVGIFFGLLYTIHIRARAGMIQEVERALQAHR